MTIIDWTIHIPAWTHYLLPTFACLVCTTDMLAKYRHLLITHLAETRPDRVARERLELPANTPAGERPDDCMIGAAAHGSSNCRHRLSRQSS